jgi:hypothetical protein
VIYLIHLLITLILCCILQPCGANQAHFGFLLLVPFLTALTTIECIMGCLRLNPHEDADFDDEDGP